ncbi:hypothetical protein NE865_10783 [Phthorimaea operculella]|nr:hypothetical protein NE865_10783 [Phthorimaea operculella]
MPNNDEDVLKEQEELKRQEELRRQEELKRQEDQQARHECVSGVSVQSRIIPFWREFPTGWFAQFEAVIDPQRKSDNQRYALLLQQLKEEDLRHLTDILKNPPTENKYKTVKERLIASYEQSNVQNFEKLIGEQELSDQKPTQLLRRLPDLGAGVLTEDGLKIHWMKQLPVHMRTVLAINTEVQLDKLALMADKMLEYTAVASIAPLSIEQQQANQSDQLSKQISELTAKVDELYNKRSRDSQPRSGPSSWSRDRSRSRSLNRRDSAIAKIMEQRGICWYHATFAKRAHKCSPPCAWKPTWRSEN